MGKEIIARQEEDDVAEKAMMKGMTASIMQKLIENLRWMMRTMIFCPICQGGPHGGPGGEGGEDSFTEITVHQEKDDAAGTAIMKGMMPPSMKKLREKLKTMTCDLCHRGSFAEIMHQEVDDAAARAEADTM